MRRKGKKWNRNKPCKSSKEEFSYNYVLCRFWRGYTQTTENKTGGRSRDGVVCYASRVLQSWENIPSALWNIRAAVCMINYRVYQEKFKECFVQQYSMIHRLGTNRTRNVAKFFAQLSGTDAMPCHVFWLILLNGGRHHFIFPYFHEDSLSEPVGASWHDGSENARLI